MLTIYFHISISLTYSYYLYYCEHIYLIFNFNFSFFGVETPLMNIEKMRSRFKAATKFVPK